MTQVKEDTNKAQESICTHCGNQHFLIIPATTTITGEHYIVCTCGEWVEFTSKGN